MQNPHLLTLYVRKVDKTAIKLHLSYIQQVSSVKFYDLLIGKREFLKFIGPELSVGKAETFVLCVQDKINTDKIRESFELYYGGDLIDKRDFKSLVKLKNSSIVHVVVRKLTELKQSQRSNPVQAQQKDTNKIVTPAAKSQYPTLNEQNKLYTHIKQQQQLKCTITLNILLSKNTSIINQNHYNISFPDDFLPIKQHLSIQIDKNQFHKKSIKQTLAQVNLIELFNQQIKTSNLCRKQFLRITKVKKLVLKLVHMGKATSISIYDRETVNPDTKSCQQTPFSYLNIFDKSQVIVLVSLIQIQTQQAQVIATNPNISESLFLELQHTLTIRLYEQYKKWQKQWSYGYSQTPLYGSLTNKPQKQKSLENSPQQYMNLPPKTYQASTGPNPLLSQAFQPLKQLKQFYQVEKNTKPVQDWIKNNQNDTIDDCEVRQIFYKHQDSQKGEIDVTKKDNIKKQDKKEKQKDITSERQSILIF